MCGTRHKLSEMKRIHDASKASGKEVRVVVYVNVKISNYKESGQLYSGG